MSKNPISLLQEIAVIKFNRHPKYEFEEFRLQEFKCRVSLCDFSREASGRGKKAAKALAAEAMLQELGISNEDAAFVCGKTKVDCLTKYNLLSPSPLSSLPQSNQTTQLNSGSTNEFKEHSSSLSVSPSPSCSPLRVPYLETNSNFSNDNISSSQKNNLITNIPQPSSPSSVSSHSSQYLSFDEEDIAMSCDSPDNAQTSYSSDTRNSSFSECSASTSFNGLSEKRKSSSPSENLRNPVSFLYYKLSTMNIVPEYVEVNVIDFGTDHPTYFYEVRAIESAIGSGSSKREAKMNAALSLMPYLGIKYIEEEEKDSKDNAVGQLLTFCQINRIKTLPTYEFVKSEGDPHCKVFTVRCKVGTISFDSSAKTKKAAKNLSAKAVLKALQQDNHQVKIEELTFESQLNNEDVNSRAWKRLDESGARNRIKLNSTLEKLPLKDYLYLFERDFYGKSETLEELKSHSIADLYHLSNPGNVFRNIIKELSIEYELTPMETKEGYLLNLFLKCHPNWSFIESGSNMEEAKRKIFLTVLEFLCTM